MTTQDRIMEWVLLLNRDYLVAELRNGKSQRVIAKEIGCSKDTLREVLRYHGLQYPYVITRK